MSRFPLQSAVEATALDPTFHALQLDGSVIHTHDDKDSINKDAEAQGSNDPETSVVIRQDDGVTRIEALYVVFGKGWGLYILWFSIGLIAYVYSLSRSTTAYYAQFATSSFGEHTVIGTIGVINGIIAGVAPPFIAKLADIWSRPHALTRAVAFYAVGYAMCAGAQNVQTVVAGQVVYTLGNTGITFLNSLLIADITSLQWRSFVNGAVNLPYVPNAFVAGYIVSGINGYSRDGWRWGFGMFCILLPVCVAPALVVLHIGDHRAKKLGAISLAASSATKREELGLDSAPAVRRTLYQSFRFYWTRLNAFGSLLMGLAFALLLAPNTLSTTAENGYKNPSLIAMLVLGGCFFIAWCVWDGFFAEYPFMPRRIFNRTLIACVGIDFFYFFSQYLYDAYFASWVWVVTDYNQRDYTFFNNTLSVAQCGFAIVFGLVIRLIHRYKGLQSAALAVRILGMGLVYYSTKNPSTAVLVSSQALIGLGGSISVMTSYIGVQGSVPHQDMAIATAVLNLISSLGSSISIAISASVWNRQVPAQLVKHLGATHNATELATIFGSIYEARLAEPRDLVKHAYLESVDGLFLSALIVSFGSLICALFATNYYLGQNHNAVETHKILAWKKKELTEEQRVAQAEYEKENDTWRNALSFKYLRRTRE